MAILQVIFAVFVFGVIGFIAFWFGVILKAGPDSTKDQIDKDPRI